jgi:hypothetical protein
MRQRAPTDAHAERRLRRKRFLRLQIAHELNAMPLPLATTHERPATWL